MKRSSFSCPLKSKPSNNVCNNKAIFSISKVHQTRSSLPKKFTTFSKQILSFQIEDERIMIVVLVLLEVLFNRQYLHTSYILIKDALNNWRKCSHLNFSCSRISGVGPKRRIFIPEKFSFLHRQECSSVAT